MTLARTSSPPPEVEPAASTPSATDDAVPTTEKDGDEPGDGADGAAGDSSAATDQASSKGAGTAVAEPAPAPKRKRRRVFRKGTGAADATPQADASEPGAALGRSSDELDLGWGERPSGSGLGDRWLEEQRPPHYE